MASTCNSFNFKKSENRIISQPIKGTRKRGGSKVLDEVNEEELKDYYNRYKLSGLIVQPYSNDFIK